METKGQDDTQVAEPSGSATRACFVRFQSCINALNGQHRNYLEVRYADLKLWADSVGVLAHGKASLDWRLSGQPRDIFLITSLLGMLMQFIEAYKTLAIKYSRDSELDDAKQGIDEMTDNLAWIGSAIRRSGTRSRLQKADLSFDRHRAGRDKAQCDELRAHLICIMTSRPIEHARSQDYLKDFHSIELHGIQNRLVEANLRRWHRFRYAQCHSDVLRASQASLNMPIQAMSGASGPGLATESTNTPAPRINTAAAIKREEKNNHGETLTSTAWSASLLASEYRGLEGQRARPARSTMTRISTITRVARFPKAKKTNAQRKTILCPCCCQALPLEEAEDPELWVKHLKNDIRPYTCIVQDCPTPYQLYVTRDEWSEHVLRDHPPKWRCSCCAGTRPVFQTLRSFMAHLDEKHESEVSDDNFDRIIARSTFRAFGISKCPLCDDQGPTDSPELMQHVLGHIYDFSMYALPWRTLSQTSFRRPIRTFNDVPPVIDPSKEDATKMQLLSHIRTLEWVKEFRSGDENLTPEQKARMRSLDWDDYQAVDGGDRADAIAADYFDRAGIDYFDDDASSGGAVAQSLDSMRQSSLVSSSGYPSRAPASPILTAQGRTGTQTGGPVRMDSIVAEDAILNYENKDSHREGSEAFYIQALKDKEETLGQMHPDTLTCMKDLAYVYRRLKRWEEAERLYLQLAETRKTVLGADHPGTLSCMEGLAYVYEELGRWEEAESLRAQVMETRRRLFGSDHPETLTSIANLASVYIEQGRLEEAESLSVQVMETRRRLFGNDHPHTLTSIASLAYLYREQCRWEEAESLGTQVMEARKRVLGAEHFDTLTSMHILASIYRHQGRREEAEDLWVLVVEARKRLSGAEHPATLLSMLCLTELRKAQGRTEEETKPLEFIAELE